MLYISKNDKILIVRLTALGDCLHTIPIAAALKQEYPNIFIGWAVSEKCKDVIINNPIIDKVHIIPKQNKVKYFEEIQKLRNENYTIAIDSQELLKSGIISFLSSAKYRLAHNKSREFSYLFANKKLSATPIFDNSKHVIERNLDFVRYLGIKNPDIEFALPKNNQSDEDFVNNLLSNIDVNKNNIVIAPATTWVTKFWTIENWAKVISELSKNNNIILSGSNADKIYIDEILKLINCNNITNLAGKTNILQLKILFEKADIVITPDSGSAHLAAATNNPIVIALFFATSAVRNGAFGKKNINLLANLSCHPCYKKKCKYNETPLCQKCISADVVIEKVKEILEK